jgi:predicted P-loop ATPase/GTPase
MRRFLVSGLFPYDSGKTVFAKSLIEALKDRGLIPRYFKPVGGHNGWYQYDTIMHSLELGFLIGHDAYIGAVETGMLEYANIISPLDFLTLPLDPVKFKPSIPTYFDYMSSAAKTMMLLRLTRAWSTNGELKSINTYILCRDNVEYLTDPMRELLDDLIGAFRARGDVIIEGNSDLALKVMYNENIYSLIDGYPELLGPADILIIEGYNDVAAPTPRSLDVEKVFIVGPSKVLMYDGERYREAVELLAYQGKPWSISTSKLIGILGAPRESRDLPHEASGSLFKSAIDDVIDSLLS